MTRKIGTYLLIGSTSLLITTALTKVEDINTSIFASNNLKSKDSKESYTPKYLLHEVGGKLYCYNEQEKKQSGLIEVNGSTYYFSEKDKSAITGWHTIDGKTYFFDPKKKGAAYEGLYTEDPDGDIYFDERGVMQKGIFQSGYKRYFLALPKKDPVKNYISYNFYTDINTGKRYYFDPKNHGQAAIGWHKGNSNWDMYFKEDGSMADGLTKIGKDLYLFRKDLGYGDPKNSYLYAGWYDDPKNGKRYLFKNIEYGCDTGKAYKGWYKCSEGEMYFKYDGSMADGLTYDNKGDLYFFKRDKYSGNSYKYKGWYNDPNTRNRYYFDPLNKGIARKGWYYDSNGAMYFKDNGAMAVGLVHVEGTPYYFSKIGDNYYTKK